MLQKHPWMVEVTEKKIQHQSQNNMTNLSEQDPTEPVKKLKLSQIEKEKLYGGFKIIFDEEVLQILQSEDLSDISGNKMQTIIEIVLSKINNDTAISIFAFFLELERHQINIPLQHQEDIKIKIEKSVKEINSFLPDKLKHYEFDTILFRDEYQERKIPFSMFLNDYLISFMIKTTTKEIENCINRYFPKDNQTNTCGIDTIIENAFKSITHIEKSSQEIQEMVDSGKIKMEEFTEEELAVLKQKETSVQISSSNFTLFKILKHDEYNMDLFRIFLKYPERLENFLLFLYINSEKTYKIFLQNLMSDCNSEEQCKILECFFDVQIEDLHYFNMENISRMITKKMDREALSKKILDLPKEDISELLKENFSFFIGNFDTFNISSRELLLSAEDSNEILEYLFDNAKDFGAFIIGSTMRVLSTRQADYIFNFFSKRISELERIRYKTENENLSAEKENTLENSICDAILIYLKHNQTSPELLDVFKSKHLLDNSKYFFSVISILDKKIVRDKILDFLTEETFSYFTTVLTANEILDVLCFQESEINNTRFSEILDLVLSKMNDSSIIQTLMQAESSPNYLFILKSCVHKFPGLKSFIITALKRISPKKQEYLSILEDLDRNIIEILANKDISFIIFCIEESEIIRKECSKTEYRNYPGFNRIEIAFKKMNE